MAKETRLYIGTYLWYSVRHLKHGLYRFAGLAAGGGDRFRVRTASTGADGFYAVYEVDSSDVRVPTETELLIYSKDNPYDPMS